MTKRNQEVAYALLINIKIDNLDWYQDQ